MPERALTLTDLMNQLKAEIGVTFGGNESAFARAVGINRGQLLVYLSAERDMGLDRLMICIAALDISPEVFFERARRRAASTRTRPAGDQGPQALAELE